MLLRPLADALADGDAIHGVLLATASNNDGAHRVGFTAPSVAGQASVVREALERAGVDSSSIGYIEAHGTGTRLGDPIEIAALAPNYSAGEGSSTWIGSLKTNFGHLDAGAGVAGLIKTLRVVETGDVPASLGFSRPNPELHLERTCLRVSAERTKLPAADTPRRAAVSSFGIGGTNAHAIVEQAPRVMERREGPAGPQLLRLSARTEAALARRAKDLGSFLGEHPQHGLADVAWTLRDGRETMEWRTAFVARDTKDAARLAGSARRVYHAHDEPRTVFLFPGQGSALAGAAKGLRGRPVFDQALARCTALFAAEGIADLERHLLEDDCVRRTELTATATTQAALFALGWALSELLASCDVLPDAVLGHSSGELTAAAVAGVLSLEDAVRLVALRGRALNAAPPGAMTALGLAEAQAQSFTNDEVTLAAINGPDSCVLAGTAVALERVEALCRRERVPARRLRVGHAFHSPAVSAAADEVSAGLERFGFRTPRVDWISTRTGQAVHVAPDAEHWRLQMLEPVQSFPAVVASGGSLFLELGPGWSFRSAVAASGSEAAWASCVSATPKAASGQTTAQRSPESSASETAGRSAWLEALGVAWASGVRVSESAFDPPSHGAWRPQRVHLPTYPFQRERLWVEPPPQPQPSTPAPRREDALRTSDVIPRRAPFAQTVETAWREALGLAELPERADFFALGGSSLVALTLVERLSRELRVDLSSTDLLSAPELSDFLERVRARLRGAEDDARSVAVTARSEDSPSRAPIWLFPGIDGEVLALQPLAQRLDARTRILRYGQEDSVAALARACAREIRSVAGARAVTLLGWSFGGLVAFETARALRGTDTPPARIVLLDTHFFPDLGEQPIGLASEHLPETLLRAARRYRPTPAPFELELVLARDDPRTPKSRTRARWQDLAAELIVQEVPGDHHSILKKPQLDTLVQKLGPLEVSDSSQG